MADIAVTEAGGAGTNLKRYVHGQNVVWVTTLLGFVFLADGNARPRVARTTDGGTTWTDYGTDGTNKYWEVFTGGSNGVAHQIAVWYDGWTQDYTSWAQGKHSTRIHVVSAGAGSGDIKYAWIDVFEDNVQAIGDNAEDASVDIVTGLTASVFGHTDHSLSICRARSGRLYVLFNANGGASGENGMYYSDDEGATWTDTTTTPFESDVADQVILLPGSVGEDHDVVAVWLDISASAITMKRCDASDTFAWTEGSAFVTSQNSSTEYLQMSAARRFDDGHYLVVVSNPGNDNTGMDLLTFDITDNETVGSMTITAKTNVVTNLAESGNPSICIDQATAGSEVVYVTWVQGGTWVSSVDIYIAKSSDGMTTWAGLSSGDSTQLNADASGQYEVCQLPMCIGSEGGRVQPVWMINPGGTRKLLTETVLSPVITSTRPNYYTDVAVTVARHMASFEALWRKAATRASTLMPIMGLMIGDSQEDFPGGSGSAYAVAFNAALATAFGNAPATQLMTGRHGNENSADAQSWGGGYISGGGATTVLAASEKVPSWAFGTDEGNASFQPNLWFAHDGRGLAAPELRAGRWFTFSPTDMPTLLFHIIGHTDSGPFTLKGKTQARTNHDVFSTTTIESAVAAGQDAADKTVVVWEKDLNSIDAVAAGNIIGGPYIHVQITGDGSTSPEYVESFGMRLVMPDRTGVVVDFSGDSRRASGFESTYADMMAIPKAMTDLGYGYSFIGIHFGTHEIGNNTAPETYKTEINDFIDWIRADMGNSFPIILFTDAYRDDLTGTADREKLGRYAGVLAELAAALPNVMAVNTLRIVDHMGWTHTGETEGLYTDQGAYSAVTAYSVDDMVDLAVAGTSVSRWVCIEGVTGTAPPHYRYWRPVSRFLKESDGVHVKNHGAMLQAFGEVAAMLNLNLGAALSSRGELLLLMG